MANIVSSLGPAHKSLLKRGREGGRGKGRGRGGSGERGKEEGRTDGDGLPLNHAIRGAAEESGAGAGEKHECQKITWDRREGGGLKGERKELCKEERIPKWKSGWIWGQQSPYL